MFRSFQLMIAALLLMGGPSYAQTPSSFTAAQTLEIEKIMSDLLMKKPEIIMQSVANYQTKQTEEAEKKSTEALVKNKDRLFKDAKDPVGGNPKGSIAVVEFFDYNCGYCKKAHEEVKLLLQAEKDVRFIYKEYPVLSESSQLAAKAALAADKQKKYIPMHSALMEYKGALDEAAIMDIASKTGLDKDRLQKDMKNPEISAQILANQELGREIGVNGTPAFIFGDKKIPGAIRLDEMKKQVEEIRKDSKN